MRYALINSSTQQVENVIEYDGAEWVCPEGLYLKQTEEADIGDFWDETDQDFYRAMKKVKPEEEAASLKDREDKFRAAKVNFKERLFLVNQKGILESLNADI